MVDLSIAMLNYQRVHDWDMIHVQNSLCLYLNPHYPMIHWLSPHVFISKSIPKCHRRLQVVTLSKPQRFQAPLSITMAGWWFGTFSIYWESSSQLTFIFFRGVGIPPTRWPSTEGNDDEPLDLGGGIFRPHFGEP